MANIYEEIARIQAEGESAALATVISCVSPAPTREAYKMLVKASGDTIGTLGGGEWEARVCQKALEVIKSGNPDRLRLNLDGQGIDMVCGGEVEVFIEPIIPSPALYIFGGGHISIFLVEIARMLDFRITVIDDRPEFANPNRFPKINDVIAEDFKTAFSRLRIDETSYLVIITRRPQYDELVLEMAVKTPARYIGMLGSKAKIETVFAHLLDRGIPEQLLNNVHTPIGLAIQSKTPPEIAISILAEIIKVRHSCP